MRAKEGRGSATVVRGPDAARKQPEASGPLPAAPGSTGQNGAGRKVASSVRTMIFEAMFSRPRPSCPELRGQGQRAPLRILSTLLIHCSATHGKAAPLFVGVMIVGGMAQLAAV